MWTFINKLVHNEKMEFLRLFLNKIISLFKKPIKEPVITEIVKDFSNPQAQGLILDPANDAKVIQRRMMPYHWAKLELEKGIREVSGLHNSPRILFYHGFTSLKATSDLIPWCSAFMNAAAMCTGFPGTGSAAALSWLNYGIPGDGKQGDIVIFKRVGGHHVAFVNKDYNGESTIECLGGNQGNAVCVEQFGVSHLLGFRRFKV